jgi:hypothetical protein
MAIEMAAEPAAVNRPLPYNRECGDGAGRVERPDVGADRKLRAFDPASAVMAPASAARTALA